MIRLPTSDAREQLSDLVNRAAFGHERIVLTRHGKELAALVSVDDLARLQALDDEKPQRTPSGRKKALSAEQRKLALAKGRNALGALQAAASARSDKLSDDDIDAEVAASRKSRLRR